jgi:hypothetical protein
MDIGGILVEVGWYLATRVHWLKGEDPSAWAKTAFSMIQPKKQRVWGRVLELSSIEKYDFLIDPSSWISDVDR